MKINLDDNYRLASTSSNITLERKVIVKEGDNKGDEIWRVTGNYSTVRHALKGYVKQSQLESKAKNMEEVIKELEQIEKNIINTIGDLVKEGAEPWGKKKRKKK